MDELKEKSKNKQTLLIVGALLSLVLIIAGVSYAIFNYIGIGSTENVIKTGGITFLYTENPTGGIGIQISNALPIPDSIGEEDSNYFDFKITSTKFKNVSIPYKITVKKIESSNVEGIDNIVKLYLTKVDKDNSSNEEAVVEKKYGELKSYDRNTDKETETETGEKILYSTKIAANKESYEQSYRLRMWIAEDANFSPTVVDGNSTQNYPYNGVTFKVQVNVYATGGVLSQEDADKENSTVIKSITLGNGEEAERDDNNSYNFVAEVEHGTESVELNIETENPNAQVKVQRLTAKANNIERLAAGQKFQLTGLVDGDNIYQIIVTSENGEFTESNYRINIHVNQLAGFFDENDNLVVTWEKSGININQDYSGTNVLNNYPTIRKVIIPEGVTKIGTNVFFGSINLTSVVIPPSVTEIESGAFHGCSNLTSVDIPSSVTSFGPAAGFGGTPWLASKQQENPLVVVNNVLIAGYTATGAIVIPEGVTKITAIAFRQNMNVTSIEIPESVTEIGNDAFQSCHSLSSIIWNNTTYTSVNDFRNAWTNAGHAYFSN